VFAGRNYSAVVSPYPDDPGRTRRRRWFTVPWGTPVVTFENIFLSTKDQVCREDVIGEHVATAIWTNATAPHLYLPGFKGTPIRWCGNAGQWLNGPLTSDPVPAINPNTGAPVCCGFVGILCQGGVADGGRVQLVSFDAGGVADGGRGQVVSLAYGGAADGGGEKVVSYAEGGVAAGGYTVPAPVAEGGVAGGGSTAVASYELTAGGVAGGGSTAVASYELTAGGVAEGGNGSGMTYILASGGVAGGGGSTVASWEPAAGGVADGGTFLPPKQLINCSSCTGGKGAYQFSLTCSGVTNGACSDCANVNAAFTLSNTVSCHWESSTVTVCGIGQRWTLDPDLISGWSLKFGTASQYALSGSWDCKTAATFTRTFAAGSCNTWPATIVLTPL
jgi:hypothetical protein